MAEVLDVTVEGVTYRGQLRELTRGEYRRMLEAQGDLIAMSDVLLYSVEDYETMDDVPLVVLAALVEGAADFFRGRIESPKSWVTSSGSSGSFGNRAERRRE